MSAPRQADGGLAREREIGLRARMPPACMQAHIASESLARAVCHLVGALDLSRFDAH
jgi:hypothetical protein